MPKQTCVFAKSVSFAELPTIHDSVSLCAQQEKEMQTNKAKVHVLTFCCSGINNILISEHVFFNNTFLLHVDHHLSKDTNHPDSHVLSTFVWVVCNFASPMLMEWISLFHALNDSVSSKTHNVSHPINCVRIINLSCWLEFWQWHQCAHFPGLWSQKHLMSQCWKCSWCS